MTELQCSMVSKEITTVFWIIEMWVHCSTCVYMCMISIVYFTGYIFCYYSHCSNLCCWSFGEATKLWLWIKCGKPVFCLLSYGMYWSVCVSYWLFLWGQECTSGQERKIPLWHALMVWSQLSQCHLFLVCLLKMTLISTCICGTVSLQASSENWKFIFKKWKASFEENWVYMYLSSEKFYVYSGALFRCSRASFEKFSSGVLILLLAWCAWQKLACVGPKHYSYDLTLIPSGITPPSR